MTVIHDFSMIIKVFFLWLLRELWHPLPYPVWLTPPSSQVLIRSVLTRQAAGKAKRAGSTWSTSPATCLATNTQARTRRKSRANHNRNPCENSPCSINRHARWWWWWGRKEAQQDHICYFHLFICIIFFCERDFRFPALLKNWNNVYIDRQETQLAGTFLDKNEDYHHALKFQKGGTEWRAQESWTIKFSKKNVVYKMSTIAYNTRSSQNVLSLIRYRQQQEGWSVWKFSHERAIRQNKRK